MRTVDSDLTAALLSGNYIPYAKIHCQVDAGVYEHHDALYYELTGTACKVMFKKQTYISCIDFCIERGCVIDGADVGCSTSNFYPVDAVEDSGIVTILGSIFNPVLHIQIAGNYSYETVLTDITSVYGKTAVFKDDTDAYWGYEFLGANKYLDVNRPGHFISIIRQKYLLFCCDNGNDEVLFFYPGKSLSSGSVDWTVSGLEVFTRSAVTTRRNMLSRDENYAANFAYTSGAAADYPRHNLGYIKSTDSMPRVEYPGGNYVSSDRVYFEFTMRPDLRYQDGDSIYLSTQNVLSRIQVKEIWNHPSSPTWRMEISAVQMFQGTEAGNMPAEMLNVAPYTPLFTGEFDKILNETDTYLQHALETLDDHPTITGLLSVRTWMVPPSLLVPPGT